MALSISNITIELREILLKDRPASLYEISPKGTVPVLQLHNKVIDESLDIINWAVEQSSDNSILFQNIELQNDWIHKNDTEFKKWLDRYKYNERFDDFILEECKSKANEIIKLYEKNLDNHSYLIGEHLQMVDICIFPFIRQFANVKMDYFTSSYPNTKIWLDKLLESELFKSVMNKYPQWQIGDSPLIINFKNELIEA